MFARTARGRSGAEDLSIPSPLSAGGPSAEAVTLPPPPPHPTVDAVTVPLPTPSAPATRVPTILAADTTSNGSLTSEGDIHVDGRFDGDIRCAGLTIGRDGNVTATVHAQTARVFGRFEGKLIAEHVEVMGSARIRGRVFQRSLEVQRGAEFLCDVRGFDDADAATAAAGSPITGSPVTVSPLAAAD